MSAKRNFSLPVTKRAVDRSYSQLDAQQRAVIALCPKLAGLFQEIWPRAKSHPSASECFGIATALYTVKAAQKPRKTSLPATIKHGRLFLRHLPAVRRDWEDAAQMFKLDVDGIETVQDQANFQNFSSVIDLIDHTERLVQSLLDTCTLPRPPSPNPATFIATKVQAAWRRVKGAKIPRSDGPDDPLCRFVTAAMGLIGKNLSPHSVSGLLRNRRPKRKKSASPPPRQKGRG